MLRHDPEKIFKEQRTARGLASDAMLREVRELYEEDEDVRKEQNDRYKRAPLNSKTVHTNKLLSDISIAYQNDEYIGERLFGLVRVTQRSDSFAVLDKRNLLNAPDDLLSERANANEVQYGGTTDNYSLKDYGLKSYVDNETIENADDPFLEILEDTEMLLEQLALKREIRLAAIATTAASYSGNTTSIAGSEWNATVDAATGMYSGGNPINNIRLMTSSLWSGLGRTRKVGFTSLDVFNVLSNHRMIRGLFGLNDTGLATKTQIASYFGLDDLLVGEARYDAANITQAAAYARIWGNVFGVVRVADRPTRKSAQFGSIFRKKSDPYRTEWFSPDEGKSGGHYSKCANSEDYKVVAPDTGYLLTGVIL